MNASTEQATEPAPDRAPGGWRKVIALVLIVGLPVGVAAVVVWQTTSGQPDDPLALAAEALQALPEANDPEIRRRLVAEIVAEARPHRDADGPLGDRARLLWQVGRIVEGGVDLDPGKPIELNAVDARTLQSAAAVLFRVREFGLADQAIAVALAKTSEKTDPELRLDVLRTALVIRFDLGRDDDVLSHVKEAIRLAPNDARPHEVAALVHRNRGHWDHFVDAQLRAVELTDDVGERRFELVEGYVELGQTAEARKHLDVVLEHRPELLRHLPLVQPRLLLLEGRRTEADELVDRYLAENPDDVGALLLRGRSSVQQARFREAADDFERVLALEPANEEGHYQLGQALARLGDEAGAAEHLELHQRLLDTKVRLYELERRAGREPNNAQVRRELARVYGELGLDDLADFWSRAADSVGG